VKIKHEGGMDKIPELQMETLLIVKESKDGWRMICGGVWIDKDRFITARHCVTDEEDEAKAGSLIRFKIRSEVNISKMGISLSPARWGIVSAVSEDTDLALVLAIDGSGVGQGVKIGNGVGVGEKVIVMGHTGGMLYNYLEGMVAGIREDMIEDGDKFLAVDVSGWHGNSGGGVFDMEGRLVGICSFLMRDAPGHVFFVHVDKIQEFLRGEGIMN
jgi:S1-C subfamily serine protease